MSIELTNSKGISTAELSYMGITEKHITVVPLEGESYDSTFQRLVDAVREQQIIFQIGFGSYEAYSRYIEFVVKEKGIKPPVTWVGGGTDISDLSGIFTISINGDVCIPIYMNEDIIGYKVTDDYAEYVYMSNIQPEKAHDSRESQVMSCFDSIKSIFENTGMDFNNIVRTWFYNNNLLEWYNSFNKIRTEFYLKNNVTKYIVPASTGIGGSNYFHKDLVLSLLAMKPLNSSCKIREADSPLQSSAQSYGSTFSRAVEISTPFFRKLLISGTAPIAKDGKSIPETDVIKQIEYTFDVIKCLLDCSGMDLKDVTRVFCYFKEKEHIRLFNEYYSSNKIFPTHIIMTNNIICRPELLFEIELDAIKSLD